MKTTRVRTEKEILKYRSQQKKNPKHIESLDFSEWEGDILKISGLTVSHLILRDRLFTGNVWMDDCKILGNLDNTNATFEEGLWQSAVTVGGDVLQNRMTVCKELVQSNMKVAGNLHQKGINVKLIMQQGMRVKGSIFRDLLEPSDIEFLKSIPFDLLRMELCQSDTDWLDCETIEDINNCGTKYSIHGYAEAMYFVENGVKPPDFYGLYPRLKYMFYLSDQEARAEIERILGNYKQHQTIKKTKEVIETILIKTPVQIRRYRVRQAAHPEYVRNLDFSEWEEGIIIMPCLIANDLIMRNRAFPEGIWMDDCKILGNLDNTNATFHKRLLQSLVVVGGDVLQNGITVDGYFDQSNMNVAGNLHQENVNIRSIFQSGMQVKGSIFRDPLEPSDIEFLKSIPLDILDMKFSQSNQNWAECKTIEEIPTCGTTYSIRGYAEAEYFIKHRVQVPDSDALYPRLKYLFYLSDQEAKNEIQRILENYK